MSTRFLSWFYRSTQLLHSRGKHCRFIQPCTPEHIQARHRSSSAGLVKEADRDASVVLSLEQKEVMNKALNGESVFFTGPSGTGKSLLLRRIIHELRSKGLNVAVTASTGISAVNIEGGTLHAFSGIGLGNQNTPYLIKKAQIPSTRKRWQDTDVLVIDEISMIDARIFDVISQVGQVLRGNSKPFGGLQLVVSGDFFQLPPVADHMCREKGVPVGFAFEAQCWDQAVPTKISLTEVFRQKEKTLVRLLNEMRLGTVSDESLALFQSLARNLKYKDGIKSTEIFPLRRQAERANQNALNRLSGERAVFSATDQYYKDAYGVYLHPQRGAAQLDRLIPDTVELKVGAQVMSVKNMPGTNVVNGSVGVIKGFLSPQEARKMSDISTITENSSTTRALSDRPLGMKKNIWENKRWPIVKFQDGKTLMITPYCFTHKNALGMVEASRWQVPLILAWALTVHKAQGQTIRRIKIDLEGTFEKGQAYVAISRCTSLEGLEVHNFSREIVEAHPTVQGWHQTLTTIPEGSVDLRN